MVYFRTMSLRPDQFIPDRDPPGFQLLGSYLHGPPVSVAEKYITAYTTPGDLIVDPFACCPTLARHAYKMDRRFVGFESNPVWAWIARSLATIPGAAEINAMMTRLGDALKDDVALRSHLSQLYATRCVECNQITPADYFTHSRDEGVIARHYSCAHCGAVRDDPATQEDIEAFRAFDAKGMHYHLAFGRVVPEDEMWSSRIRNLLDLYSPRSLYALVTLTVKGDTLFRAPTEQQLFNLVLLHLLDRGTSLYAEPDKPAAIARHKRYVEFNLWRAAEFAARELAQLPSLPLMTSLRSVTSSQTSSLWLGRSSAKAIADELPTGSAALVLTTPPSRRAALGALSYFWGAWILRRDAVKSLVPFLDPERADPSWERRWYFESLAATLNSVARMLRPTGRAVFVFDESNYESIEALLLTASGADLNLETFLFQPRLGDAPRREFDHLRANYRIAFTASPSEARKAGIDVGEMKRRLRAVAQEAGRAIMTRRGEPLGFPWLHHAAYARAAREGLLKQIMQAKMRETPGRFAIEAMQGGLRDGYAQDFDHYEGHKEFLWFVRSKSETPLIDRIEKEVMEMRTAGELAREELEDRIYEKFSGDLTPEDGLVDLCVRACAQVIVIDEHSQAVKMARELGARLGYTISMNEKPFDVAWMDDGELVHGFVWRDRPAFEDLLRIHVAPARGYLIVRESLVEFLCEKVRRLQPLVDAYREAGWDFVRVSSIEKLTRQELIARNDLVLMPGLVPMVAEPSAQLELL
jgi:hypothetical protein